MSLDHGYGVVVGTFASFRREDPKDFGHWYHGKLRVSTPAGEYEAALDVDTPSGIGVSYRLVTDLTTARIPALGTWPAGFTPLPATATSGALDYVRSPLLQDGFVVTWLRRLAAARTAARSQPSAAARPAAVAPAGTSAPAAAGPVELWAPTWVDTLLQRLLRWFGRWRSRLPGLRRRSFPWVRSDGDNALDVLEPLLRGSVRLYVFGEPYTTGLGVHNVHMNQGDPPGPHQAEDGVWQDGAVLCEDATGAVRAWQIKFNTQSLQTNDVTGLPT